MSARTKQGGRVDFSEADGAALRSLKVGEVLTEGQWESACQFVRHQDDIIRNLRAALAQNAQGEIDGDAPCEKCGSVSVDTGFECNDCGHDNMPSHLHAERARVPAGLRERIERAWHNHDEEGRVHISMGDARLLVEQVLAAAPSQPDTTGATP